MSYRGETDAKRIARHLMFTMLFRSPGWLQWADRGKAIVLAGDGGDLRALRALGWPAQNIVCADLDAERVRRARETWPEVDSRHCDIREAIATLPRTSISLAILDFCGHLTDVVQETVRLVGGRLRVDGCVTLTYLRGREGTHTPEIHRARFLANRIASAAKWQIPEAVRMEQYRRTGYVARLQEWLECGWETTAAAAGRLGGRKARPLLVCPRGWVNYDSGHSPMGVAVVHAVHGTEEDLRDAESPTTVAIDGTLFDPCAPPDAVETAVVPGGRDPKAHRRFLRDYVLQRPRMRASDIADWLNLPVGQIAAWRAVATRERRQNVG